MISLENCPEATSRGKVPPAKANFLTQGIHNIHDSQQRALSKYE